MADFYRLLGVSRQASEREIKAAYRRLAKLYHPDVNPSPTAAEDFARITEAYKVLSSRRLRALYDRGLLADYEEYVRQRERAAVLQERVKVIIEELLRREREETTIRQMAVMLTVSLFAAACLVALVRPPIFEMLGVMGKAICLGLFGLGMWELVRDVMACLDYYAYPDDITPSLLRLEEERAGKPFSRTAVLAFLVGGVSAGARVRFSRALCAAGDQRAIAREPWTHQCALAAADRCPYHYAVARPQRAVLRAMMKPEGGEVRCRCSLRDGHWWMCSRPRRRPSLEASPS